MVNTPDGRKWTAWSVARWRDRGLGEGGRYPKWTAQSGGFESGEGW